MDAQDLDKIKYALTFHAYRYPDLEAEVVKLCGRVPKIEANAEHLARCGHENLLPFWQNLIDTNANAREFAAAVWEKYQASLAGMPPATSSGPGTELKKLLKRVGIVPAPGCKCNQRAYEMDRQGADWCEQNLETLVGWLEEEAAARKLPFVRAAGRVLVRRAIHNARKTNPVLIYV